jgi:hypothetical protein
MSGPPIRSAWSTPQSCACAWSFLPTICLRAACRSLRHPPLNYPAAGLARLAPRRRTSAHQPLQQASLPLPGMATRLALRRAALGHEACAPRAVTCLSRTQAPGDRVSPCRPRRTVLSPESRAGRSLPLSRLDIAIPDDTAPHGGLAGDLVGKLLPGTRCGGRPCFSRMATTSGDFSTLTSAAFQTWEKLPHSHSIVAGGLLLTSYTTRLIPRTSLIIRELTLASKGYGNGAQSAVMKSEVCTARKATT